MDYARGMFQRWPISCSPSVASLWTAPVAAPVWTVLSRTQAHLKSRCKGVMKLAKKTLTEMVNRIGGWDVKNPVHSKMKCIWKSDIAFTRYLCEVLLYGLCLIRVWVFRMFPLVSRGRDGENQTALRNSLRVFEGKLFSHDGCVEVMRKYCFEAFGCNFHLYSWSFFFGTRIFESMLTCVGLYINYINCTLISMFS
jgi:hypothetical protein